MYQLSPKRLEVWKGEWRAKGELAFPGKGVRPQPRLDAAQQSSIRGNILVGAQALFSSIQCNWPLNFLSHFWGALQSSPSLTTVLAGPHTAVRRVELCVNSQTFCIMRRQETTRSLRGRPSGLHPYLPPEGQTVLAFCRVSSLRSHCLLAFPFIPLTGTVRALVHRFRLGLSCCSAFRHWSASLALPTA
jgi:hypothetical protein